MPTPASAARELARTREIAAVLFRHGLGDLAHRLGLAGPLRRVGTWLHVRGAAEFHTLERPARVREALEELGPTFVKLGQLLAGRTDLLPPAWTSELGRLREHARAVPWDELRAQLAEDLGAEPETLFDALDPTPLAAASIAQVHRARLAGREVVLKIRRPGIRAVVEADLELLERLAAIAERELAFARHWNAREIVREFRRSLTDELDLRIEARHHARVAASFADEERVCIPRIQERFTRERLLVMEYLDGPSVAQWIAQRRATSPGAADEQARALAALGADLVLEMVFAHGLYHADPHAGNVLVLADGRLGLIDFGMVGRLSDGRREELSRLLGAVIRRRDEDVVDVLAGWSRVGDDGALARRSHLAADCDAFLERWYGVPLAQIDVRTLLADVAELLRENGMTLPADLALLLKVFVTLEGLGRELDPEFDMARHAGPFVARELRRARQPLAHARRSLLDAAEVAASLPGDLRRMLAAARRGRFKVELDLRRLDHFGQQIDRSANRLTMGMVTAALIIGTSISLTVAGGPRVGGLPLFGVLGFASSIVLGIGLISSVRRSNRG